MAGLRIAIVVVAYEDAATLAQTLHRIPPEVWDRVEVIRIVEGASRENSPLIETLRSSSLRRPDIIHVSRNASALGYGARQKVAFDRAVREGYDLVVLLHGSGRYAPEVLAELLEPAQRDEADVVVGSRLLSADTDGNPVSPSISVISRLLAIWQARWVGLRLSAPYSGFRVYRCRALSAIPYQRCSDDVYFDAEILLQLHAAGFRVAEHSIPGYPGSGIGLLKGLRYVAHILRSAVAYWLHQNGLLYIEPFDVSPTRYPLKTNRWSSHQQLVRLIPPSHRVLDVGCGDGLLARLLRGQGCEVVGVDQRIGPAARAVCARTYTADLDDGLEIGDEPPFQTILLADVLSHVKEADQLLMRCHQRLAPDGQLVLSVGNVAHLAIRLGLLFGRFDYTPRGILERKHVVLYTWKSLRRLLARQQFRVASVGVTPIPFETIWPSASHRWWVRGLTALSYGLAKGWKTLFAYQFIVVAIPMPSLGLLPEVAVGWDASARALAAHT